jgi:Xaa-Pro dipeptidase
MLQANLKQKDLAGGLLFNPENIFWLTGYQTIGYFAFHAMFVPQCGAPAVIAWVVNRDLALAHPTIGRFVTIMDADDPIRVLSDFLNESAPGGRIGIETTSRLLTVRDHRRLTDQLSPTLVEWNGIVEPHRVVKNVGERSRIRRACRAAELGLDAAIMAIEPGKTENDIAAAMMAASISAGSEYLGHPPLVVAGKTTALCFAMWRRREIRPGDVVLLESAGCVDRYHGMISRPVVVGIPAQRHRDAADALCRALDAAIEAIRPGALSGNVDRACRSVLEEAGFGGNFLQEVGYGVGIGFPPNWSESAIYNIGPQSNRPLEAGMTFHVIPTLFFEDFGMCFSDTVLVTESGCEVLTHYPRKLVVV